MEAYLKRQPGLVFRGHLINIKHQKAQESIPLGCELPAKNLTCFSSSGHHQMLLPGAVPYLNKFEQLSGGHHQISLAGNPRSDVGEGKRYLPFDLPHDALDFTYPFPCGHTDACENITFPQNSRAVKYFVFGGPLFTFRLPLMGTASGTKGKKSRQVKRRNNARYLRKMRY